MSTNQSATVSTDQTAESSSSHSETLQSPSIVSGFEGNKINQNGILSNVRKANKSVRKKKKKIQVVAAGTTNANKGPRKRRKKVSKANLDMPTDPTANVVTDEAKNNFKAPWQGNNSSDLGKFGNSQVFGLNEQVANQDGWNTEIQAKEKIHNKQNDSLFSELNDTIFKFEHFALLVEEYYLVLDSLKN